MPGAATFKFEGGQCHLIHMLGVTQKYQQIIWLFLVKSLLQTTFFLDAQASLAPTQVSLSVR